MWALFQLLDETDQFTDEELAQFEREYEERRQQMFEGNVQPGEINVSLKHLLSGKDIIRQMHVVNN